MNRLILILAAAITLFLSGCVTYSATGKIIAESKLSPVVAAIEGFKAEAGRVPETLEELQAKRSSKLVLSSSTDDGLVWSINYEKKSSSSYVVSFDHVHYDLVYEDGKEV